LQLRIGIMTVNELLKLMVEKEASDLHLRVPSPPVLRIDGELWPLEELPPVTPEYMKGALNEITSEGQRQTFYAKKELDLAHSVPGLARFRVNAFFQRGSISIAVRQVSLNVPDIDQFGLPAVCKTLALKKKGLVLVTGPTGSGKSTTLAAMINHINTNVRRNIITIEDPIEYVYKNDKCLIAQRDLGDDTLSFASALRQSLRQDPNVILVGEMRDLDTISTAITAAETGHLVLSTVHTSSAPQTIERIVDVFPAQQQRQVQYQLSLVLEGVLSQVLVPLIGGRGRVAAIEVMVGTDAIRNLIREGRTHQIPSYIQTGRQDGMQTMDQALQELVRSGTISVADALMRAASPGENKEPAGVPSAAGR